MPSRKVAAYTINVMGFRWTLELRVSPTVKVMHGDIKSRVEGMKDGFLVNGEGTVTGMVTAWDRSSSRFVKFNYATMYLVEDRLGAGYVAHECLHAAMAYERAVRGFRMDYGHGEGYDHADEERLADTVEWISRAVWNILLDNGHAGKARRRLDA